MESSTQCNDREKIVINTCTVYLLLLLDCDEQERKISLELKSFHRPRIAAGQVFSFLFFPLINSCVDVIFVNPVVFIEFTR